jgi:hypothetical protein
MSNSVERWLKNQIAITVSVIAHRRLVMTVLEKQLTLSEKAEAYL